MKLTQLIPLFVSLAAAHAATLTVTTTADTGAGSLRAKIAAATTGDTVAITATGTIALTTGEIAITGKNLTVAGPGANNLTITTGATTRALKIVNAQCTISGITFNNCKGLAGDVDTGGAIAVDNFSAGGTTNITTISDCAFTNNQSGWGGALDVFQGGLSLNRCTFTGNTATGLAFGTNGAVGAIHINPYGYLTMTVSKNPAATDVTIAIEVAGDLGAPSGWSAGGTTVDQNSETTFQAHDNTPISAAPSRFIRLKLSRP